MFKVNNKNTTTKSLTPFWYFYCKLWTYFTFSSVFIINKCYLDKFLLFHIFLATSRGRTVCYTTNFNQIPENWLKYHVLLYGCFEKFHRFPWKAFLIKWTSLHKKWSFPLRISSANVTKPQIWSHLKKSLMENLIFCAVLSIKLVVTETYSQLSQISQMDFFAKIVKGNYNPLISQKSSIFDAWLNSK